MKERLPDIFPKQDDQLGPTKILFVHFLTGIIKEIKYLSKHCVK